LCFVGSLSTLAGGCSSSGSGVQTPDAGFDGGSTPEGGTGPGTCTGVVTQNPPATNACTGDKAACLSGTVNKKIFKAVPAHRCVSVYPTFPQGTATPLQTQMVASDDTWAFDGLPAGAHYYVIAVDDFAVQGGTGSAVPAIVGPLSVPAGVEDAGAPAVYVKPAQLELLESKVAGGSWQAQWASAHLFDPSQASELEGTSTVDVVLGGAAVPLPWQGADAGTAPSSYYAQFSPAPPAQPAYSVVTGDPALGNVPLSWQLVANPPSFDGTIVSPANGSTLPANMDLTVTWMAEPTADYELTELYQRQVGGGWKNVYTSPQPNAPSVTSEKIPGGKLTPGQYLLNVGLATANCPASADGCVFASAIAAAQFTLQ
jgi:hypothetical protein